jgi:hypothetical protein
MELSTSFNPDRTLKMQTPGAQAGPVAAGPSFLQGLDPNLISQLLNAKLARNAPQVQAAAPREMASDGYSYRQQTAPQLGAAPMKEQEISRVVNDPRVSPYHKMATGQDAPAVRERYIPGVGWEFDGIQGRGSSGGRGAIETQSQPTGGYSSGPIEPYPQEQALKVPRNVSVPRIGRG